LSASAAGTEAGVRTILVVDDDAEIRDLAELVLRGAGYAVQKASCGREALDAAVTFEPDLILLDVNMPDMDGWEVLRLLQADESSRNLPVVMFTVKMEFRDKVHALQDGARDYITKPFAHDELLDRIDRIFHSLEVQQ
jgi:DNA-binding response OmpR family regulator